MFISTIIPYRGRPWYLNKCLNSIYTSDYDGEIIVQEQKDDSPFNKSQLCNTASQRAIGSVLVLLDADIIVPPTYGSLIKNIASYDRICFYIKEGEKPLYFAFDDFYKQSGIMPVGNSCFAVRKDDYIAVGGMDERFLGHDYHDQDLINRLNLYFSKKNGKLNNFASFAKKDTFEHLPHVTEPEWMTNKLNTQADAIFWQNRENNVIRTEHGLPR